jgi:hypothetical protein
MRIVTRGLENYHQQRIRTETPARPWQQPERGRRNGHEAQDPLSPLGRTLLDKSGAVLAAIMGVLAGYPDREDQ